MELVKPDPLIIGGKAHYTLTSYEPVSVEVEVHNVSEEDVDLGFTRRFPRCLMATSCEQ